MRRLDKTLFTLRWENKVKLIETNRETEANRICVLCLLPPVGLTGCLNTQKQGSNPLTMLFFFCTAINYSNFMRNTLTCIVSERYESVFCMCRRKDASRGKSFFMQPQFLLASYLRDEFIEHLSERNRFLVGIHPFLN